MLQVTTVQEQIPIKLETRNSLVQLELGVQVAQKVATIVLKATNARIQPSQRCNFVSVVLIRLEDKALVLSALLDSLVFLRKLSLALCINGQPLALDFADSTLLAITLPAPVLILAPYVQLVLILNSAMLTMV